MTDQPWGNGNPTTPPPEGKPGDFPPPSVPAPPYPSGTMPPGSGMGPPASYPTPPPIGSESSTSVPSLLSLLSAVLLGIIPFVGAIIAIVLGIVGLRQVKNSNNTKTGGWMAGVGIGLGVLGLLGWIVTLGVFYLAATNDEFQAGIADAVEEAAEETTPELAAGTCLESIDVGDTYVEWSPDDVVSCSDPHEVESAGSIRLPQELGAPFPGDDPLFVQASDLCAERFQAFTGVDFYDDVLYDMYIVQPTEINWRLGDRVGHCFIVDINGGQLTSSAAG